MFRLERKLGSTEVKYKFLTFSNFKSIFRKGSPVTIVDADGINYQARMHVKGYMILGLSKLYEKFKMEANDIVLFQVDPQNLYQLKVTFKKNVDIDFSNL